MDEVAQGAVWSEITAPILNGDLTPITDGANAIVVTLTDRTGTDQSTGITVTHLAGGKYLLEKTLPANAALRAWTGTVVYGDGSLPGWEQDITFTVVTAAQADPAGALSGATVEYTGPVAQTGAISIVRGDAYLVADGRALTWNLTDADAIPDLTGATITFSAQSRQFSQSMSVTGAVTDPSGETKQVRVELTSVVTSAISAEATGSRSLWDYLVRATLPVSGTVVTLVSGPMTVTNADVD